MPLCRLSVFGARQVGKRKKYVAWQDWHASARDEQRDARLAGAGSFYWASPRAAWRRARVLMARDPAIEQISVATISARPVGRMFRTHAYACHQGDD